MMALPNRLVETSVEIENAQALFEERNTGDAAGRFQVSRDRQRFLMALTAEGSSASTPSQLIQIGRLGSRSNLSATVSGPAARGASGWAIISGRSAATETVRTGLAQCDFERRERK